MTDPLPSSPAAAPPPPEPPPPPPPAEPPAPPLPEPRRRRRWGRVWLSSLIVVLVLLVIYYVGGMIWLHVIDDNLDYQLNAERPAGASRAVALAADLIDREVNQHEWVGNDPFFLPGSLLDNMPNFQQGIIAALSRFAIELTDHLGRSRGSSQADPDLDPAAGLLRYPGNVWVWNPATSLAPTASSESQYRQGRQRLLTYNDRLSKDQATFDPRSDNLLTTLDRITTDLGSASAQIDQRVRAGSGWLPDFQADNLFYFNKGRLYGYYLLLRELQTDFANVVSERDLATTWRQTLDSLREGAAFQPWVIVNGPPDGLLLPSHVAVQGFYLLRARTQLKELVDILEK